jgi:hypothetical protein
LRKIATQQSAKRARIIGVRRGLMLTRARGINAAVIINMNRRIMLASRPRRTRSCCAKVGFIICSGGAARRYHHLKNPEE